MKRWLITTLVVAGLGATGGGAYAAVHTAKPPTAVKLTAGQAISYAGITCTTYAGTTVANSNIVCVRDNLKGYGVVVSQNQVIVARQVKSKVVVAFKEANR